MPYIIWFGLTWSPEYYPAVDPENSSNGGSEFGLTIAKVIVKVSVKGVIAAALEERYLSLS